LRERLLHRDHASNLRLVEDAQTLLANGAQALWVDGDLCRSREAFDAGYRAAEAQGDGSAMAEAALGLGGLWVNEHRDAASAAVVDDRLRRALASVPSDSSLALRLRTRMTAEATYRGLEHGSILEVLAEARRAEDPVAHAEALSLAHHCLLGPDHSAARLQIADALIAESARTARRGDLLMGVLWRLVDLLLEAHPHADRQLTELRELLAAQEHLAIAAVVQAVDIMLDIRAGQLTRAEDRAKRYIQQGSAARDADAAGRYGAQMLAIRWFQGRIAELVPALHALVASPTLSVADNSHLAALALACAVAGDHRPARRELARLGGRDLAAAPRCCNWLVTMYAAVEAAYLLDEREQAAIAYQLLLPFAQLPMIAGLGVACFGSVQHALGVASLTTGNTETAVKHLQAAVRDNIAIGHWPAAILARARLAVALQYSADRQAQARSVHERESAEREARELGTVLPARRPVAQPASPAHLAAQVVTCVRTGRQWRVDLGNRSVHVTHCIGMTYLAILFANPGHEISSMELTTGPGTGGVASVLATTRGPVQPVLDQRAVQQYRQRLASLHAEIDRSDIVGDRERAIEIHEEREWLLAELRAASGLAGRRRPFATTNERARIAVGKAIRRALQRIAAADPIIGAALSLTIQTGYRCSYTPFRRSGHGDIPEDRAGF